jgi:hypothetical protein
VRFGPFRYCTKVDEKLAELAPLTHNFAKQSYVGNFCNERKRSTLLEPKLMFWGRFGQFRYCTKVDAKLAELAPLTHKFAKLYFWGVSDQFTPLDLKLIFWGALHRFVTARKLMKNWLNLHY